MLKYFTDTISYPNPASGKILPTGTLYEYVSSTFLSGWINHVRPVKAFLITRYERHSQNLQDATVLHAMGHHHTDLSSMTSDDVLILARSEDRLWWFFWNDRDCSDCMVGRFTADDQDDAVIAEFCRYAEERSQKLSITYAQSDLTCDTMENASGCRAIELDVSAFRGWISF